MRRTSWFLSVVVCALSVTFACTKGASDPLTPSAGNPATGTAGADGSTLKATAPVPLSPTNGLKPTTALELKITNSTTVVPVPLTYRFQILDAASKIVYLSSLVPSGSGTTSHNPSATLTVDQAYKWQARAEYQGKIGPWSVLAAFVASFNGGYIVGNEIYDPLINGKTVGTIFGPVTFLPGIGLRLDSDESYVEYALPQTLTGGEYSALISNLGVVSNNEDPKYRVMTMRVGLTAMNDNPYRVSLDKRGNGAPAYRFISGDAASGAYIESGPGDRTPLNFQRSTWYFWRAQWSGGNGGIFRFTIDEDTQGGKSFYDLERPYKREYRPNPHMVYIGSPYVSGDRGEPSSCKDMIIKQVWVSPNPRPAFANQ